MSWAFIHKESSGTVSHADLHLKFLAPPKTLAERRPGDFSLGLVRGILKRNIEHMRGAASIVPYAARNNPVSPDSCEAQPGINEVRVVFGVAGERRRREV